MFEEGTLNGKLYTQSFSKKKKIKTELCISFKLKQTDRFINKIHAD